MLLGCSFGFAKAAWVFVPKQNYVYDYHIEATPLLQYSGDPKSQ